MDDVNVFSSKRSDLVRIDKCSGSCLASHRKSKSWCSGTGGKRSLGSLDGCKVSRV